MNLQIKRKFQTALAVVSSLSLMLCSTPVLAEDIADLENRTSDLQAQLSGINQEMLLISNEIATAEMQVEIINGEILRTEESLEEAQTEEDEQYEKMSARIKYIYETGNANMLEMLFTSKSLSDFLNAADFVQLFNDCDQDMLADLRDTREKLSEQKSTLKAQQDSLLELQSSLNEQYNTLTDKARATSTDLFTYYMQLQELRAAEDDALNGSDTTETPDSGTSDPPSTNDNTSQVSSGEVELLAALLECEAYQDYECLLAVATVIMNRVNNPRFDNTITGVIYASGQFEPVWTGRLNAVLSRKPTALSYQAAQDAVNGIRHPAVSDCYYFLYAGSTSRPGVNIGNNLFFQSW